MKLQTPVFHARLPLQDCNKVEHKLGKWKVQTSKREKERESIKQENQYKLPKKSGFPLQKNTRRDKVKNAKAEKDEREYDLVNKESQREPKKCIGDQVNAT